VGWKRRGAAALGLAAAATLLVLALPPSSPGRALGTTAVVRSVAVTDVVLGVGADEAERRLAWLSADPAARCVEYADPAGSTRVVEAYDSGAAVVDGMTWFHAALPGLEAGTAYSYRVGNCAAAWAEPEDFAVPEEGPFSFLLLGDPQVFASTGGTDPATGWATTLRRATSAVPDAAFLATAGDHVNSTNVSGQVGEWDLLLRPPELRQYAVAPVIGNHDEADGTGLQYGQHLARPNEDPAGATVAGSGDYWFTHGSALFMSLNTNSADTPAHADFLRRVLAANPDARWTIVLLHHAPFSAVVDANDDDVARVRAGLTPVLSELGIDLVLGGHDHSYTRSLLMDGTGVVAGSEGPALAAREGQVLYITANSASGGKYYEPDPTLPWVAVANQEEVPNWTHVRVGDRSITVTTHRTTDGSVLDRVVLREARAPLS
jgi:hypothetical protein